MAVTCPTAAVPHRTRVRAAGPAKEYVTARHPLVRLMAELTRHADCDLIQVSKPGFALTLEKSAASPVGRVG